LSENGVMIKFENISRRFGGTEALKSVSFTINKGEIHALVGENGAESPPL
jgi:ribose transport system ATP-binding protein